MLHLGQHADQWVFDSGVQLRHALFIERIFQRRRKMRDRQGVARSNPSSIGTTAEIQLTGGRGTVIRKVEPRVAIEEVAQGVPGVGGVDEVGGDRRVEPQPGHHKLACTFPAQQPAHQRFGIVAAPAAVLAQRHQYIGRLNHARRQPRDLCACCVGDDCQPEHIATTRLARPRGNHVECRQRADQSGGIRRTVEVGDLGFQRLAGRRSGARGRADHAERVVHALVQGFELEKLEQALDFLVVRPHHERLEVDLDRGVASQRHHLEVVARSAFVLDERGLQLRRLRIDVGEDSVQAAVLVEQFGGGLLADTGHTFEVVAGVAAQRRVLRVDLRRDARLFLDTRFVVQRVVAHTTLVVEHLHVWIADELVAVAVACDDYHVVTSVLGLLRQGGQNVVGLPADELEPGDPQRVEHFAHEAHLLAQDVGRGLALRLVGRVHLVAERGFGPVEGHQQAVGLLILHHVGKHRGEAEDCVRDLPRSGGHVGGQREERSVRERVAVEEEDLHGCNVPARMRSATSRMRERSLMAVRWMKVNASLSFSPN
ncbi:unannotated protein [freshwater metagenome]|uniref:Unannotated protein n=1 Tax=freshwater metagenome TaxID=449393 RepID=A0A6J7A9A2_9ZZZZ